MERRRRYIGVYSDSECRVVSTSLPPADSWWSLTCTAGGTLTSPPKVGTPLVLCLLNTHFELTLKYLACEATVRQTLFMYRPLSVDTHRLHCISFKLHK